MDPTTWGPSAWAVLHWTALHADGPEGSTTAWTSWVSHFLVGLPCEACRKHATEYWKTRPYDASKSAFEWTVHFHNAVNERLGKSRMSVEESRKVWAHTSCYQTCTVSKDSKVTLGSKVTSGPSYASIIIPILVVLGVLAWIYREELASKDFVRDLKARVSRAMSSSSVPSAS